MLLCSSVPPSSFLLGSSCISHSHRFCSPSSFFLQLLISVALFAFMLVLWEGRGLFAPPLYDWSVYKAGSAPFLASTVRQFRWVFSNRCSLYQLSLSDFYSSASFLCHFILTEVLMCQIRKQSTFDQESKVKLNPKPRLEMPRVDLWWPLSYFS